MQLTINLLTDLVTIHPLVDVHLQNIIGIGKRAIENGSNSLKINGIRLLSVIFSKYENQQMPILNEILVLAVKCGTHEEMMSFSIKTFSKNISIFCALVMTLLQSIPVLPGVPQLHSPRKNIEMFGKGECLNFENMETAICRNYRNVQLYSQYITYELLRNCLNQISQNGVRINYYQTAFTDFIHDLLDVLIEPEWPVSHMLLFDMAKHMVNTLQNTNLNAKIHILCLGWLGEIMLKVKECDKKAEKNIENLNKIIMNAYNNIKKCGNDEVMLHTLKEETRFQDLQSIFLNCVVGKIQARQSVVSVENFYLSMWYCDLLRPEKPTSEESIKNKDEYFSDDNKENVPPTKVKKKLSKSIKKRGQKKSTKQNQKEYLFQLAKTTSLFVNSLHRFDDTTLFLNHSEIKLITGFFIHKGDFIKNFNLFLTQMVYVLKCEQSCVRAKSMQCLKMLMDVDVTFSKDPLIQCVMQNLLNDSCITVREITIGLIGKSILCSPGKCEHYYQLIIPHLLDKGVSVRKQVLKILRDITTFYPNFPRMSEMHLKILERIQDSDLKAMIVETLKNRWFTPSNISDNMIDQIKDLNGVLKSSGETGLHCFKVLVEELFDANETFMNCKQFVKCLVHYLLKYEVNNAINDLCDCLKMLNIIAQVKPEILVTYISALQPYLSLHHQENENIIFSVTEILKHTIPLYENPPESFLVKLEEDLLKLLFIQKHSIVERCVPCLTVIVMEGTHNDKIIFDCFNMLLGIIKKFAENKLFFSNESLSPESYVQRCLLILGLFLKYYDFSSLNAHQYFEEVTIDDVFNTFLILLKHSNSAIQWYTLKALGEMCCQHCHYLLNHDLKVIYCNILSLQNTQVEMKQQVLRNIKCFLQEDSQIVTKIECSKRGQKNVSFQKVITLQEEDENSNITKIIVIQQYLEDIMNCCIVQNKGIRCTATIILKIILRCGLIPPQKVMAHLIALTTERDFALSVEIYDLLKEIDQSHPGIFDFCIKVGINLSYDLQILLQNTELVRGYNGTEAPAHALLSPLYQIVQRNKLRRRNFLRIIMHQCEEMDVDVNKLLYLTDNLAFLPYELEDELLFVIQFINVIAATIGYSFIKKFQQQLLPDESRSLILQKNEENEDDYNDNENNENFQNMLDQLPLDTSILQTYVYSFQSCLLLLKVKQYLQHTYGITNRMVLLYSSEQRKGLSGEPLQLHVNKHCKLMSQSHLEVLLEIKGKKTISNEHLLNQYLELKNLILYESDLLSKKRQLEKICIGKKEKEMAISEKTRRTGARKQENSCGKK